MCVHYATSVYLSKEFEKSLRLYGFLGLRPDLGVVYGRSPANAKRDLWEIPLTLGFVCLFFGGLIWMLYVFQRMTPVNFDLWNAAWPMVIGAVGTAIIGLIGIVVAQRSEVRKRERRIQDALESDGAVEVEAPPVWTSTGPKAWLMMLLVAAGGLLIGAAFGASVAFAVN